MALRCIMWHILVHIWWKARFIGKKWDLRWIFCTVCMSDNLSYFHMISIKELNHVWKHSFFMEGTLMPDLAAMLRLLQGSTEVKLTELMLWVWISFTLWPLEGLLAVFTSLDCCHVEAPLHQNKSSVLQQCLPAAWMDYWTSLPGTGMCHSRDTYQPGRD